MRKKTILTVFLASIVFCEMSGVAVSQAGPLDPLGGWGNARIRSRIYAPEAAGQVDRPLIVVLHGCLQSARDIQEISRFNELAKREGFVVLYPEQSFTNNSSRCWNWFRPQDQRRGGEPEQIVGLVEQAKQRHNIDSQRVYVVGFSAGGGMAAILANCYPDVFAKVAIFSGTSYLAARSMSEAFTAMKSGSRIDLQAAGRAGFECSGGNRREPISSIHIHGESDNIVTPLYLEQAAEQFTYFNDWLDDGQDNGSFRWSEPEVSRGEVNDRQIEQKVFRAGEARQVTIRVFGMNHTWSGGAPGKQYSDPRGPDATALAWKFFQ